MSCPPEVARILLEIIRAGVLRTRAAAWSGDAARAADEADHIHNLPRLLSDFSPEGLEYYWNVERPSYIARHGADHFQPLWDQLRTHVEQSIPSAAGEARLSRTIQSPAPLLVWVGVSHAF